MSKVKTRPLVFSLITFLLFILALAIKIIGIVLAVQNRDWIWAVLIFFIGALGLFYIIKEKTDWQNLNLVWFIPAYYIVWIVVVLILMAAFDPYIDIGVYH